MDEAVKVIRGGSVIKRRTLVPIAGAALLLLCLLWTAASLASPVRSAAQPARAPGADFSASYKTGPATAHNGELVTYTIVVSNAGALAPNVVLSDDLPYTAVYVPGSCTYRRPDSLALPCGPLTQLWQEDLAAGERITTTLAVQVAAGTMNWPLVNCAHLRWDSNQRDLCFTTIVNRWFQVYLPSVLQGFRRCVPWLVRTIPTGPEPHGVALDLVGRRAFVAHADGVTVIDADSLTPLAPVQPLTSAHGVTYDPDHDRLWVTRFEADRVAVLDGTTLTPLAELPTGDGPHSAAYNPANNLVYVTNFWDWTVSVYDSGSTVAYLTQLTNFAEPAHLAVNPVTNKIYVANHRPDNHVTVIDGATHSSQHISTGLIDAYGIAVDPTRNLVYVTAIAHGRISIIDGATDQQLAHQDIRRDDGSRVPLRAVAVNPHVGSMGHLWLTTSSADGGLDQSLLIPNGWPALGTPAPLDLSPHPQDGIAVDPTTNRIWVTSLDGGVVSVIQDGLPVCHSPFTSQ